MSEESIRTKLNAYAKEALDELWSAAHDAKAAQPERVKLLQYFVALGVGTPRQMTAQDAAPEGGGVVILPEVMDPEGPPAQTI